MKLRDSAQRYLARGQYSLNDLDFDPLSVNKQRCESHCTLKAAAPRSFPIRWVMLRKVPAPITRPTQRIVEFRLSAG